MSSSDAIFITHLHQKFDEKREIMITREIWDEHMQGLLIISSAVFTHPDLFDLFSLLHNLSRSISHHYLQYQITGEINLHNYIKERPWVEI